jgi:hypothetical protein
MKEKSTFTFIDQATPTAEVGGFMAAKTNKAGVA